MKIDRYLVLLFVAGIYFFSADILTQSGAAVVGVSARVKPSVSKKVVSQAWTLTITPEDIERSYVDVRHGTVLKIRCNNRGGYFLAFENRGGPFREVWIIVDGKEVVLSGNTGLVHQPHPGVPADEIKEVSYRFYLSPDAKPGSYEWPVKVDVVLH